MTYENLIKRIDLLEAENKLLREENVRLLARIAELERRLNQNSSNSSKPPSADAFRKSTPKSLREKSGRVSGGQKGHVGSTLLQVENPDETLFHQVSECRNCQTPLAARTADELEKRQVFEIPDPKLVVVEHLCEKKICPECGSLNEASFPAGVENTVQYGPRIKGLMTYMQQYQLLPYERLSEFFKDIFGASISQGTLFNTNKTAYKNLSNFEEKTKELLINSPVLHGDETGLVVKGKLHWLHTVSSDRVTFYSIHAKRGREATDAAGILPHFEGTLVHDCWASYFSYNFRHALCNAHLLRELNGIIETDEHSWAKQMHALLIKANADTKVCEDGLSEEQIEKFVAAYKAIVSVGLNETGGVAPAERTRARNLLHRFVLRENQVLLFLKDPKVPFDNNQAERDIRMVKVKQKISGCFRSEEGASYFARIRGFISTAKKQGENILDALESVFHGQPFSSTA